MKKRNIIILVTVLLLTVAFILPSFSTRIIFEQKNKGFVTSLDVKSVQTFFDADTLPEILKQYKESGITTAVIREDKKKINDELIEISKNAGFDIALMIYGGIPKEDVFFKDLEKIISEKNVKYLLLKDLENPKKNSTVEAFNPKLLSDIIEKHPLTLVLCESITQLSNERPEGYEEYIKSADGRIVRLYETQKKSVLKDKTYDLTYFQMLNSAIDRNCKFILVNQLTDGGTTPHKEAARTCRSIKLFKNRMISEGYSEEQNFSVAGYNTNLKSVSAASGAIMIIMLYIMLSLLSKKKNNTPLFVTAMALSAIAFAVTFLLPTQIITLYATAFSVIAPCFIFTIVFKSTNKSLPCIFLILTLSISFCGMVLSSLLSGADYHLNTLVFRGVKLTLIVPVIFAAMLMFFTIGKDYFVNSVKNIKLWQILLVALIVAGGFIYIRRSGNASISDFENIMRNNICKIFAVRPRTKEFLIGWPCFFLFVYYAKNKKAPYIKLVSALGTSVLLSSITNSFCHVFTNTLTIYIRTLNGFIMSVPFVLTLLIINYFINKKAR